MDAMGQGCRGWRAGGGVGRQAHGMNNQGMGWTWLQTPCLGHLSKAKGLVQGLDAPAQAPLTPPGTAAQIYGLEAAGKTCSCAELPPSPSGPGTQLCAHPLPNNGNLTFAHQPALKSLFFTPTVPAKHYNHHQSLVLNLHI